MKQNKKVKKVELIYQPTNILTEGLAPEGVYKLNITGKIIFLAIVIIFGIILFIEVN